ncbi:hypothetical protein L1987_80228 [Smallanthus sonchifolius]|uniref:Uncharacterized protein n=1 Tax=Smallanthus sonchifolius TaxID=185202 RepID=A0ACB8YLC1_9ASTR|nr:hypothetical protein L1987_80228 [Smallanthus sonchifolius]
MNVRCVVQMAASPAPSAQVVGNAFVEQYYHILHQSPELVHKFYQDSSILSRPDTSGLMTSAIDEKIQSLGYKNFKAEIKTADAQDSNQAGVIFLVTGCLTGKDNVKRKFAQTFFLAPQEKGYFVQNDVFRYVEKSAPSETTSTSVENAVDSAQADLAVPNSEAVIVSDNNPTCDSTTTLAAEDLNNGPEVCDPEDNEGSDLEEEVVDEPAPVQTSPNETVPFQKPDPFASQEEKKSYASIVRVTKITGSSGSGHAQTSSLKWAPANTNQLKSRTAKPSPEPEASVPVVVNGPESSKAYDDGNRHFFVHLLFVDHAYAEHLFVCVRRKFEIQHAFCFGFVEFVSLDSMHSAIKAPSVTIGDRQVVVEEKRTTTRVGDGGGRGRYHSGRGSGFRGRGGNFGGRNFGRNEFRYQGELSNRSKGPPGRNSELYQRVDQNGGGRTHQSNKDTEPRQ